MRTKYQIQDKIDSLYDNMDDDNPSSIDRQKVSALEWALGEGDPITGDNYEPLGRLATEQEIKDAIESLTKERGEIAHFSVFGDDNWGAMDGKTHLLKWIIEEAK